MVKEEEYKGKTIFVCEACGFGYETKEMAQKCEDYCNKNHSCSLEITKLAIRK